MSSENYRSHTKGFFGFFIVGLLPIMVGIVYLFDSFEISLNGLFKSIGIILGMIIWIFALKWYLEYDVEGRPRH